MWYHSTFLTTITFHKRRGDIIDWSANNTRKKAKVNVHIRVSKWPQRWIWSETWMHWYKGQKWVSGGLSLIDCLYSWSPGLWHSYHQFVRLKVLNNSQWVHISKEGWKGFWSKKKKKNLFSFERRLSWRLFHKSVLLKMVWWRAEGLYTFMTRISLFHWQRGGLNENRSKIDNMPLVSALAKTVVWTSVSPLSLSFTTGASYKYTFINFESWKCSFI